MTRHSADPTDVGRTLCGRILLDFPASVVAHLEQCPECLQAIHWLPDPTRLTATGA